MNGASETQTPVPAATPVPVNIEALNVSAAWKRTFQLIEKAGGLSWGQPKNPTALSASERMKLVGNFLALLFGPFYYFAKRMPKKAVVIFAFQWWLLTVITVVETLFRFTVPVPIYFVAMEIVPAMLATGDYYKKMVHGEDMWPELRVFSKWPYCLLFFFVSFIVSPIVAAILGGPST